MKPPAIDRAMFTKGYKPVTLWLNPNWNFTVKDKRSVNFTKKWSNWLWLKQEVKRLAESGFYTIVRQSGKQICLFRKLTLTEKTNFKLYGTYFSPGEVRVKENIIDSVSTPKILSALQGKALKEGISEK